MGFFGNIGSDIAGHTIDLLKKGMIIALRSYKVVGDLKKAIPNIEYDFEKDILVVYSKTYPDIRYEFDMTEPLNAIANNIITYCGNTVGCHTYPDHRTYSTSIEPINILKLTQKDIQFARKNENWGTPFSINCIATKGVIKIVVDVDRENFKDAYLDKKDNELRLTPYKWEYSLPIKENPVSVFMDLRNYITKNLEDIRDGKTSSIEIKKGIEEYLKRIS